MSVSCLLNAVIWPHMAVGFLLISELLAIGPVHFLSDPSEWPKIGLHQTRILGAFCQFSQPKTAKYRVH